MKRLIALIFTLLCLLPAALAGERGFGEILLDKTNLRRTPGGAILCKKQQGDSLYIVGEKRQGNHLWYRVNTVNADRKKRLTGWVRADTVVPPSALFTDIASVAADGKHLVALKKDGTVVFAGPQLLVASAADGQHPMYWQQVKKVAAGFYTAYGLLADGSLTMYGIRGFDANNPPQNMADLFAGSESMLGKTREGALYQFWGNNHNLLLPAGSKWVAASPLPIDASAPAVLMQDGRVQLLGDNVWPSLLVESVSTWHDIRQIAAGYRHITNNAPLSAYPFIAGIQKDGTVVAYGKQLPKETSAWQHITKLAGGDGFLLGLAEDGRVLVAGEHRSLISDVQQWTDIVDIAAGTTFAVGVQRDGRVVFAGTVVYE